MSAAIDLRVDELIVETSLERERAEQLGPVLQAAFQQLLERLRRMPGGELAKLDATILDRLEFELDDAETLLGPAGPAMLAEQLFEQLLARTTRSRT